MHSKEKIKQKYILLGNTDVKRPVTKSQPETPRSNRPTFMFRTPKSRPFDSQETQMLVDSEWNGY